MSGATTGVKSFLMRQFYLFVLIFVSVVVLSLPLELNAGVLFGPRKRVIDVSSAHPVEGEAIHAIDGDPETYWHTRYEPDVPKHPHFLVIDLGKTREMRGFVYVPRLTGFNGRVAEYEFYVSNDSEKWDKPVHKGTFPSETEVQSILFDKLVTGRYIKFVALSEVNGRDFGAVAELDVITDPQNIPFADLNIKEFTKWRARSVHLGFSLPASRAFYNEITVKKSQTGSYFMVCGFRYGYFGIQELVTGKKVVIFSVWDPGDQDGPNSVPLKDRVKILHHGDGVEISRFGGEGTGGKSFFSYNWEINETYRFLVKADVKDNMTAFSGYFFINKTKKWKHLVTFQTETGGIYLEKHYSFIEDFRRDFKSYREHRYSCFGNGWVYTVDNKWLPITKARFTADNLNVININAGVKGGRFFLETGGKTKNVTPLGFIMQIEPAGKKQKPDLTGLLK